jgi:hypothetical protein
MSQRRFVYRDRSVLTGWDRPLQMFFLVIERVPVGDEEPDDGEPWFSNLDDPEYPFRTVDVVIARLRTLGVAWPASLCDDLLADQQANQGNLHHTYPPVPSAS